MLLPEDLVLVQFEAPGIFTIPPTGQGNAILTGRKWNASSVERNL